MRTSCFVMWWIVPRITIISLAHPNHYLLPAHTIALGVYDRDAHLGGLYRVVLDQRCVCGRKGGGCGAATLVWKQRSLFSCPRFLLKLVALRQAPRCAHEERWDVVSEVVLASPQLS